MEKEDNSKGTPEPNPSQRPWIKPVFESEPLKNALSGQNPDNLDMSGCGPYS
jgi:hypothetical protein